MSLHFEFLFTKGLDKELLPLMHILYIQFVQFAFNNVRFQVREEGGKVVWDIGVLGKAPFKDIFTKK